MLYADRILGGRHAGIVAGLDRPVKFPLFLVKGSDFLLKPLDFFILFCSAICLCFSDMTACCV